MSLDNYQELVTDLVGVRALYFFKDDFKGIHDSLMQKLRLKEKKPTYYHRKGDLVTSESNELKSWGLLPKEHPVGYRSIHYVAQGGIDVSKSVIIEIQVRSLFDEAWSEIDHKIRYPVFDNNPLIGDLLQILNKLVGGADEMSNYIKHLSGKIRDYEHGLSKACEENEGLIERIVKLEKQIQSSISEGRQLNASALASDLGSIKKKIQSAREEHPGTVLLGMIARDEERKRIMDKFNALSSEQEKLRALDGMFGWRHLKD
ncbi:hypothetical protein F3K36_31140 [Delftia sp. BR1]|nr:hypothetical protein F3K36_31140 [Delftia sp. BR1]